MVGFMFFYNLKGFHYVHFVLSGLNLIIRQVFKAFNIRSFKEASGAGMFYGIFAYLISVISTSFDADLARQAEILLRILQTTSDLFS